MNNKKINRYSLVLIALVCLFSGSAISQNAVRTPGWPQVTKEAKPWSRWWWMGSGVDPANLKAAMEAGQILGWK